MTSFKLWSLRFTTPSRLRHHSGRGDEEKSQQILYSVTQCTVYQSAPYFQQIARFQYVCVYVISLTHIRIVWPAIGLPSWKSYCSTALSADPLQRISPKAYSKGGKYGQQIFYALEQKEGFHCVKFRETSNTSATLWTTSASIVSPPPN